MGKTIKIRYCLVLFAVLPSFAFSQALSPKSKAVKAAWEALVKQPGAKQCQLTYLRVFPENKHDFIAVFDRDDFTQLYTESNKYIESFIALVKNYPAQVIDKSINIGKDLRWNADAINYLQHGIVEIGISNTIIFSKKLNSLTPKQKGRLVKFLADVENHKAYPQYQQLINALTKTGEKSLAHKFELARTERENEKE